MLRLLKKTVEVHVFTEGFWTEDSLIHLKVKSEQTNLKFWSEYYNRKSNLNSETLKAQSLVDYL